MVIDASIPGWVTAFVVTVAVEVPVWSVVAAACQWGRPRRVALAGLGVNIATHPVLFASAAGFRSWWQLLAAELAVVVVEALLVAWWLPAGRRDGPVIGLAALLANLLSFAAGLAIALL